MIEDDEDRVCRVMLPAILLVLLIGAFATLYMPRSLAMFALSWVLLSFSAGIGFGHCVRNDP